MRGKCGGKCVTFSVTALPLPLKSWSVAVVGRDVPGMQAIQVVLFQDGSKGFLKSSLTIHNGCGTSSLFCITSKECTYWGTRPPTPSSHTRNMCLFQSTTSLFLYRCWPHIQNPTVEQILGRRYVFSSAGCNCCFVGAGDVSACALHKWLFAWVDSHSACCGCMFLQMMMTLLPDSHCTPFSLVRMKHLCVHFTVLFSAQWQAMKHRSSPTCSGVKL